MTPPRHDTAAGSGGRTRGGLYVHVPFCASICDYCHFARVAVHDAGLRRRVVDATVREARLRREGCPALASDRMEAATAYFGGGTPSILEPGLFAGLVAGTLGRFPSAPDIETTAEANPESFDQAVAEAWTAAGVNRISLGVQSLDDRILRSLGRRCDAATARRALALAVESFPRVSADWILAPGTTLDGLAAEFREARDMGVDHVSFYILEIHPGTPLAARMAAGAASAPPDAETEKIYLEAVARLEDLGFAQYEVANFALPGGESRHNRSYWRRVPYLGLGPGAHGFTGAERYANLADPREYCDAVEAGRVPTAERDPIDAAARRLEELILPLRTVAGVPRGRLPRGFPLDRGLAEGLWTVDDRRLALTPRGMLRIDDVELMLARILR